MTETTKKIISKSIYPENVARVCNQLRKGGFKRASNAYWVQIFERDTDTEHIEIYVNR